MGCQKLTYHPNFEVLKGGFAKELTSKKSVLHARINYIYGFNGMEKDDEAKGKGNSYTTEFRQYDPRLGRWLTLDPLMAKYPWASPYNAFNNNPMRFTDRQGLEGQDWIGKKDEKGNTTWKWDKDVKSKDQLPTGYTEYAKSGHTYNSGGRTIQLGENSWTDITKNSNGNYTNQQGMDIQWSGEDEANTAFKMKMKGLDEALDNLKLAMGAVFAAPWVAGAAILTSPIWSPVAVQGLSYGFQGVRLAGQYSMQGARAYHNTFGKTGGYLNIGANYFTQSFSTGSMNPLDHNAFEYGASAFVGKFSIQNQALIGGGGGLINYTPSENKVKHLFNQNAGITLGNVLNGGIAPLYNLGGPVSGFVFGNVQQAVGGRAMNNLEKQLGDLNSK